MTENPYRWSSPKWEPWNEGYDQAIEDALRVSQGYPTTRDIKALRKKVEE